MKLLLFLLIANIAYGQGDPAPFIKGQSSSGLGNQASTIIVPGNQSTKINAYQALIETGSENMLVNPGFEGIGISGWTCTTGTCTKTIVAGEYSSGKAAMKVALSSQAMNVSQSVSIPSGIQKQGFAKVIYRVPSSMADFQVCTLVDAAEQTCVPSSKLILDNVFHSIEVPLVFGSTSAGIKFKTTSSYTGNAFFDGAVVAQGLGLQNLMLDNSYSAQVSSSGVVSGETVDWINGNCTVLSAEFECTFKLNTFSQTPNCQVIQNNPDADFGYTNLTNTTSKDILTYRTRNSSGDTDRAASIFCQKSGNDYLASSATVYSQASANFGPRNDGVITLTGTGASKGTATTDRVISTRFGNRYIGEFQYVQTGSGTAGSSDYLIALPNGYQFDTTSVTPYNGSAWSSAGKALALAYVGTGSLNNDSATGMSCNLYAYSLTQFRAYCLYTTSNGGTASGGVFGGSFFSLASPVSFGFQLNAPISGWSNSPYMVGSLENVPTVPGSGIKSHVFSFSYGTTNATTVCSANPCSYLDQIGNAVLSVNYNSVGNHTVVFSRTYSKVKCIPYAGNPVQLMGIDNSAMSCSNCSSLTFITYKTVNSVLDNSYGTLYCQGEY